MGIYEDAMESIQKRTASRRARRNESFATILSFLEGADGSSNTGGPAHTDVNTPSGGVRLSRDSHGHIHATRTPGNWRSTNAPGTKLTTVNMQGKRVTVYSGAARAFTELAKELEKRGYRIRSAGGYNYRNMTGSNKLSMHAYGRAVDINPERNPYSKRLITDMPRDISAVAKRLGLVWGGDWRRIKDAMHFEYYGR